MSVVLFDLPPIQGDYDEEDVRVMNVGRRQLRTEWPSALYPPDDPDKNWRVVLPFPNTYRNAFLSMCDVDAYAHEARNGRLCLFLNGTEGDEKAPQEVLDWLDLVGGPVAMKDHLALSFALDYEREGGSPDLPQTKIGTLRARAKPYGAMTATKETKIAAGELGKYCVEFLKEMTCYESASCVVAMPPSDPAKKYSLPRYLAEHIAAAWGREDLTMSVRTVNARNSIKAVALAEKFDTLAGTIEVDDKVFAGKHVLLVDDLYQSGISMNYCGLLLLRAGARKIFGLACEKTCRNDDNVGRG
ncbi:MAG TPA: hypothetical protein VK302_21050 [Terriglobales bacterium]|nr:hypothetical protein [Terriglobales bacterium]